MSTVPPITPLPPLPLPNFTPYTQTTPFTVRDGATFLLTLEGIRDWIQNVLTPELDSQVQTLATAWQTNATDIANAFNTIVTQMTEEVNAAIALMGNQVTEANAAAVAAAASQSAAAASEAQAAEYASTVVAFQDTAVAGLINNTNSAVTTALASLYASKGTQVTVETGRLSVAELATTIETAVVQSTGLNVMVFGAKGDGVTDDTVAIQAAINAAQPGQAVIFPDTGSGSFYLISATLVVTTANLRLKGQPRDAYSISIRTNTPNLTMVQVKAPSFVMEDIGLIGVTNLSGGNANGASTTVTGLEIFGDTDGNMDCDIKGSTFQFCLLGILLHGRNATVRDNLFSNCQNGIQHNGPDPVYHTGPNASQNRGNQIRWNRFHNIGTTSASSAVYFTTLAKVLHAIVANNHFDSGGSAQCVVFAGTSTDPHRGVQIIDNKMTEVISTAINLSQCQYPLVADNMLMGGTLTVSFDMVVLMNTLYASLDSNVIRLSARHGYFGQNNTSPAITGGEVIQVGQLAGQTGDAVNMDSTNTDVRVHGVRAATGTGSFFNGDPNGGAIADCSYASFTLAAILSKTLLAHSQNGQNRRVEGRYGRIEDTAYGQYPLVAATPTVIATVQIGANFGAFILEIECAGRNASVGDAYFVGKRVIRNENGAAVITNLGADVTNGLAVTIAQTGAQTFTVSVNSTNASEIGAKIRAGAAGGASGMASANLTVTMTAQS